MRKKFVNAVLFLAVVMTDSRASQQAPVGVEPATRFAARDIFLEYNLPPLKDGGTNALKRVEQHTQVLARAERLSLNRQAATSSWMEAGDVYTSGLRLADGFAKAEPSYFKGTTASELNAFLAAAGTRVVKVISPTIRIDVPIKISRAGLDLDLGTTQLRCTIPQIFMVRIQGAENIRLQGGLLTGEGWGVLISKSHNVTVTNMAVQHATGGVLVTDSHDVVVRGSEFHSLKEAPVLLHGDTHHVLVLRNEISSNLGNSNWHAGIVISDRNADVSANPHNMMRDDNYGVQEQQITTRLAVPTNNLIAWNRVSGNASSGIYSDGGSKNVFVQNSIEGNSKEGFCLDNGSTANVVVFNVVGSNGKRWGKTDGDLQRDFVFGLGRLPDGSSPAKLPGLSIDNAAFNQILFNNVHDNYGGGIKMVRTAFYNVVGMNSLNENNEGRSKVFHFFGIELGAATADVKVPDLDFRPSRGNEIFGNTIRGKHYAGIFFAAGSDENTVFDNAIFGATDWALESVQQEKNASFNNLSNLRCRNVGTGLDPKLIEIGNGH